MIGKNQNSGYLPKIIYTILILSEGNQFGNTCQATPDKYYHAINKCVNPLPAR